MKRTYAVLAAAALAAATLAACGSPGSSSKSSPPATVSVASSPASTPGASTASSGYPSAPGSIIIGSADFPENELLADIYAGAMKAKGVSVTEKLNIGERPVYMTALKDGSIDFVPEYTGSILSYLQPSTTAKSPAAVFASLQKVAATQGLVALNYAQAQDSDTITVTQSTAAKYHLKSIGDLKKYASKMTFGAPAQFKTRADGIPALKSVYGVVFGTFTPLAAGTTITVTALKNGSITAGDIFSTDPSIVQNHFVSLKDTKNMFAAQNIVPLATKSKLSKPMVDAANAVSAKLTTAILGELDTKVAGGQQAASVASAWLSSVGLGS